MRKHLHKLLFASRLECMNTNDCCSKTFGQVVYIPANVSLFIKKCVFILFRSFFLSPIFFSGVSPTLSLGN